MNRITALWLLCLAAYAKGQTPTYRVGERPPEPVRRPEDYLPMPVPMNNVLDIAVFCKLDDNVMTVDITFERNFEGAVYAKGQYKSDGCRTVAARNQRRLAVDLPLDGCGTITDRSGEGYDARTYFNNTIIVMSEFAWGILEMGDRAYEVSCRFGGTQVESLNYNLQVPDVDANQVTSTPIRFSSCNMKIVEGRNPVIAGVSVLNLGQIATMAFWIDNQGGIFDLSVFDCYAHDGMGMSRLELIDEDGCPAHKKVIGHSQRSTGISRGNTYMFAHFKAFKFPDVTNVYFSCQCRVCFDHCYPTECDARRRKRDTSEMTSSDRLIRDPEGNEIKPGESVGDELMSESITVMVPGAETIIYDEESGAIRRVSSDQTTTIGSACVPRITFIAGISGIVALLFLTIIVAGVIHARSRQTKRTDSTDNFSFRGN